MSKKEENLSILTSEELGQRIRGEQHRLDELYLRQANPKDFPTHDVHGMDKFEIRDREARLAALFAEQKRRTKPLG